MPYPECSDDFDGVDYARRMGPSLADELDKHWAEVDRDGGYTRDWEEVSYNYRLSQDFECEECCVQLVTHQHLLHVHHLNGNKGDNGDGNLQSLCILCHSEVHHHMQDRITDADRATIESLRRCLPRR